MPHIIKRKNLEVYIDLPNEGYSFSRFDWTGKIVNVRLNSNSFTTKERTDNVNENHFGKGLYNEFGIYTPLGFEEAEIGGWFHKIGIGLLQKTSDQYDFMHQYKIRPSNFEVETEEDRLQIKSKSALELGYSYLLQKEIKCLSNGFNITYHLRNTGEKEIITDEYTHNFLAFNDGLINSDYILKFPFELKAGLLGEVVNPEEKVEININELRFNGTPKEQFFYSYLSGNETVNAQWELINSNTKIGIKETGNFLTNKINLWGWRHVISPELFCPISLQPGEEKRWTRSYKVYSKQE